MALVPIKTSMGTGYCDCIHGCYNLAQVRDEETKRGFCKRCSEEHLEMNRQLVAKIPPAGKPAFGFDALPGGAKPRALLNRKPS
ncbi:MAG: hypothetical protein ACE5HB_04505 [Terriglobia bacterium]